MAEHLTLVSLRRALSAQSSVSEKVADDFLNSLFLTIQEGLQQDGSVSINGLGTFKVQEVPERESMNVATGERFTIEGYKKVVFVAETNSRKTKEETVDPIQKLDEQAEEIKGILSELAAINGTSAQVVTEAPEPAQPEQPAHSAEPEQPEEPAEKSERPFNPWQTGLITIGVFGMLLIIAYFILRHQIVNWADGMRDTIEQRVNAEPAQQAEPLQISERSEHSEGSKRSEISEGSEESESSESSSSGTAEVSASAASPSSPYFDDSRRQFTEFLSDETVGQDSRLAWIAKKRYDEKAYWVFIYEVNRDKLKSPDHVLPGMRLRIPKLPAELRDSNEPDTKALLERLSEKYRNER